MRVIVQAEALDVTPAARRLSRRLLRAAGATLQVGPGDVVLRFVDAAAGLAVNKRWRGVDRPTDVLSFPSGAAEPGGRRCIGDIVVCWPVARAQAARRGCSAAREAALLALHGLLHVLGYDHETDRGEMAALERGLRRSLLPRRE